MVKSDGGVLYYRMDRDWVSKEYSPKKCGVQYLSLTSLTYDEVQDDLHLSTDTVNGCFEEISKQVGWFLALEGITDMFTDETKADSLPFLRWYQYGRVFLGLFTKYFSATNLRDRDAEFLCVGSDVQPYYDKPDWAHQGGWDRMHEIVRFTDKQCLITQQEVRSWFSFFPAGQVAAHKILDPIITLLITLGLVLFLVRRFRVL